MSQRDGFTGGFLTGVVVGGIFGGLMGALVASKSERETAEEKDSLLKNNNQPEIAAGTEESIEFARRSLEDKIAQLNLAIDDVRQQLGTVNGKSIGVEIENDY
ncbi:MAG: hypothetical protein WA865_14110 [Spirulinaceae cyanobacterium]